MYLNLVTYSALTVGFMLGFLVGNFWTPLFVRVLHYWGSYVGKFSKPFYWLNFVAVILYTVIAVYFITYAVEVVFVALVGD
jgi:hypothetical protein